MYFFNYYLLKMSYSLFSTAKKKPENKKNEKIIKQISCHRNKIP